MVWRKDLGVWSLMEEIRGGGGGDLEKVLGDMKSTLAQHCAAIQERNWASDWS